MNEARFSGTLIGTYIPNCTSSRTRRQTTSQKRAVSSIVTQIILLRQGGLIIYGTDNKKHRKLVPDDCFISALYNGAVLSMRVTWLLQR